ncbi:MAG: T9SS type A sorting domain-containing protein [Sphingobacteriales bacterium JAD_PAG50586_3]|nr:MAG: T9SS type A sorting domain-containing protein [Sphingobacteriales bacterium JAD_PAG50586_3]
MKKLFIISFIALTAHQAFAQSPSLIGVVRKNYYTTVFDTLFGGEYEQFDSCTVRLGNLNPATGQVDNIGTAAYTRSVNLTGAALNPYDNSYVFIGNTDLLALSLTNGQIITNVPLTDPLGDSYFDNFRFNNADSTLYGLARVVGDNQNLTQTYLAKVNTATGVITRISPQAIGLGYALAGSTIDPYQMVFYYSTGANIVGLDLYNGSVYSIMPIVNPDGIVFDNFAYSCVDTAIYGLVRKNYFSTIQDPLFPDIETQVLDSSTVRLGKINPATGVVTIISPYSVSLGGYSLNAGAAVDPNTLTYYYNNGGNIIGVSLITGLQTSYQPLNFEDGQYFDLMRNLNNCYDAYPKRLETTTSAPEQLLVDDINLFPNPAQDYFTLLTSKDYGKVEVAVYSVQGGLVSKQTLPLTNNTRVGLEGLSNGLYSVLITNADGKILGKKKLLIAK